MNKKKCLKIKEYLRLPPRQWKKKEEAAPTPLKKLLTDLTEEEKDYLAHCLVQGQFKCVKDLALALNGGQENKELKAIIINCYIKEMEKIFEK